MELITCLSTGKGTWGHVARLLEHSWDNAVLITNDFGAEKFEKPENAQFVVINPRAGMEELVTELTAKITEHIKSKEVAVNLISGSGKEHMAILSALQKAGKTYKLFAVTKDGIKEV